MKVPARAIWKEAEPLRALGHQVGELDAAVDDVQDPAPDRGDAQPVERDSDQVAGRKKAESGAHRRRVSWKRSLDGDFIHQPFDSLDPVEHGPAPPIDRTEPDRPASFARRWVPFGRIATLSMPVSPVRRMSARRHPTPTRADRLVTMETRRMRASAAAADVRACAQLLPVAGRFARHGRPADWRAEWQFRTDEGYADQLGAIASRRLPNLQTVKIGYPASRPRR